MAIEYAVVVDVIVAHIAQSIFIGVTLINILHRRAVVAGVAVLIASAFFRINLIRIVDQRAIVWVIQDAIVIGVWIASVPNTVAIGVLLSRIRHVYAVISLAANIAAVQHVIGPTVEITVRAAEETISAKPDSTHAVILEIELRVKLLNRIH